LAQTTPTVLHPVQEASHTHGAFSRRHHPTGRLALYHYDVCLRRHMVARHAGLPSNLPDRLVQVCELRYRHENIIYRGASLLVTCALM